MEKKLQRERKGNEEAAYQSSKWGREDMIGGISTLVHMSEMLDEATAYNQNNNIKSIYNINKLTCNNKYLHQRNNMTIYILLEIL